MSYPTTTYTPSKISLYNQYKENIALQKFVDALNSYMQDMLSEVFRVLAYNLDLKKVGKTENLYTSFYLRNYFGLSRIPDPSSKGRSQTMKIWDDSSEYFDSFLAYDTVLGKSEDETAGFLPVDTWGKVAKFQLDYSYDVFNLDALKAVLELFYGAFEGKRLDFKNDVSLYQDVISSLNDQRRFIVQVERKEIWENFRLLTLYGANLVGLPYGSSIEIVFYTPRIQLKGLKNLVVVDISTPLEFELLFNGENLEWLPLEDESLATMGNIDFETKGKGLGLDTYKSSIEALQPSKKFFIKARGKSAKNDDIVDLTIPVWVGPLKLEFDDSIDLKLEEGVQNFVGTWFGSNIQITTTGESGVVKVTSSIVDESSFSVNIEPLKEGETKITIEVTGEQGLAAITKDVTISITKEPEEEHESDENA